MVIQKAMNQLGVLCWTLGFIQLLLFLVFADLFKMESHGVPRSRAREFLADQAVTQEYRELVDQVNSHISSNDFTPAAFEATSELLKKNPEYFTIWNFRRKIILSYLEPQPGNGQKDKDTEEAQRKSKGQDYLLRDLQFLVPLLKSNPKCYWIWNYRQWLLRQIEEYFPELAAKYWERELDLVSKMLYFDERNFHGWTYRKTVISTLEDLAVSQAAGGTTELPKSRAKSELEYTTTMINRKLSNFSAWHQRSILIPRVLNEQSASDSERMETFENEIKLIHEALIDPNDQSLWFYHQYLLFALSPACPDELRIIRNVDTESAVGYYRQEIEAVLEILEDWGDSKWLYRALVRCAKHIQDVSPETDVGFSKDDLSLWLNKLIEIDPLRIGRWKDLQKEMGL